MNRFKPIRTLRISEAIAEQIRAELNAGALKPGDKLPPERVLAKTFGVGRAAVREALRTLEIAGIISLYRGSKGGAFIREGDPRLVANSFSDLLRLGAISIDHITEARLWIQPLLTRVACHRATEEDFAALGANVEEAERLFEAGDYERKAEVSTEFHNILARATHNPVLVPVIASLMEVMWRFVQRIGPETHDQTLRSRRRLLALLRARKADEAAAEMERHLRSLQKRYLAAARQLDAKTSPHLPKGRRALAVMEKR